MKDSKGNVFTLKDGELRLQVIESTESSWPVGSIFLFKEGRYLNKVDLEVLCPFPYLGSSKYTFTDISADITFFNDVFSPVFNPTQTDIESIL